jgi:hypothetical protein
LRVARGTQLLLGCAQLAAGFADRLLDLLQLVADFLLGSLRGLELL